MLDFNYESEYFITPISSMLETNSSITELNLSSNNMTAETARIFSLGIENNGALTKRNLSSDNTAGWKSPDFIRPIASMLKANTSIKELDLSHNYLNATAGENIFQEIIFLEHIFQETTIFLENIFP